MSWQAQTRLAWCLFFMRRTVTSDENQTYTQMHYNPMQTSFLSLFNKYLVSHYSVPGCSRTWDESVNKAWHSFGTCRQLIITTSELCSIIDYDKEWKEENRLKVRQGGNDLIGCRGWGQIWFCLYKLFWQMFCCFVLSDVQPECLKIRIYG